MKLNADASSGSGYLCIHRLRPFPTAKFFATIDLPVQAFAWQVGIKLKWVPLGQQNRVWRKAPECFFHAPFANVTPWTDEVRVDSNGILADVHIFKSVWFYGVIRVII